MNTVDSKQTTQELIDQGNKLRKEGKLEEAVATFQQAIETDANSYQAYHFLGETLAQKNELKAAANAYHRAIEINPEFFWSHHCLGQVLLWQGRLDEAIAAARQAIKLEPNRAVFHYQLGLYLERKLELDEAIASYQTALKIQPNFADVASKLEKAIHQQKKSNLKKLTVSSSQKTSAENHYKAIDYALASEKEQNWEESLQYWKQISFQKIFETNHLRSVIRCLRMLSKYKDAYALIESKNLSNTDGKELAIEIARCFQDGGKLHDAYFIWKRLHQQYNDSAEILFGLSRVLEQLGNVTQSAQVLENKLKFCPDNQQILIALMWFYQRQSNWDKVADICTRLIGDCNCENLQVILTQAKALATLGKTSEVIKFINKYEHLLKNSLEGMQAIAWTYQQKAKFEEARQYWYQIISADPNLTPLLRDDFTLTRLDKNDLSIAPEEILSVLCIRNEIIRLPWILDYHRTLGVNRFFVIDNGSDDGSIEYLSKFADVHIFQTFDSYSAFKFGVTWINYILDTYCDNHWCLLIDADEAFVYPEAETVNLRKLCNYLEFHNYQALRTHSVDMYSNKPIKDARPFYRQSLLEVAPYFDCGNYRYVPNFRCPDHKIVGGARERVFWEDKTRLNDSPPLNKVPLVKWFSGLKHIWSAHWIMPVPLADISGVLFHFKFLNDFHDNALREIERNEHHSGAGDYRRYAKLMNQNKELSLLNTCSERYQGTAQLLDLGLMKSTEKYTKYLKNIERAF